MERIKINRQKLDKTIKSENIADIEKAIKDIQKILVDDMRIPINSAKEININLVKIQERIK
jgi:hypothetical protein